MFAALWAGLLEWAAAKTLSFWLACIAGLGLFLAGGCVGCEVERHRPHWFRMIGCGRAESPEPPLADRKVACTDCNGTGRVDGRPCMVCPGTGKVTYSEGVEYTCVMCQGTGKRSGPCPMCGGGGFLYTDGPRPDK